MTPSSHRIRSPVIPGRFTHRDGNLASASLTCSNSTSARSLASSLFCIYSRLNSSRACFPISFSFLAANCSSVISPRSNLSAHLLKVCTGELHRTQLRLPRQVHNCRSVRSRRGFFPPLMQQLMYIYQHSRRIPAVEHIRAISKSIGHFYLCG